MVDLITNANVKVINARLHASLVVARSGTVTDRTCETRYLQTQYYVERSEK